MCRYLVPGENNPLHQERVKLSQSGKENVHTGGGRTVSRLDWRIVDSNDSGFEVEGLFVRPLPVLHGGDYICLGFEFTSALGRSRSAIRLYAK